MKIKSTAPLIPSCKMEDALTPDECSKMSTMLSTLVMAHDKYKVPVNKFISAYRIKINGYLRNCTEYNANRKKVIELRKTTDMSYPEIARMLGLHRNMVAEYGKYVEREPDKVG